jgi:hypothetical protein
MEVVPETEGGTDCCRAASTVYAGIKSASKAKGARASSGHPFVRLFSSVRLKWPKALPIIAKPIRAAKAAWRSARVWDSSFARVDVTLVFQVSGGPNIVVGAIGRWL